MNPVVEPKKRSRLFNVIGFLIGFIMVGSLISALLPHETEEAKAADAKNAFISSCKSEAYKAASDGRNYETICGCAYDKLQAKYNGKFVDEAQRVNDVGYTQAETDLMQECF